MIILRTMEKIILTVIWIPITIIGIGIKFLVHITFVAKTILGLGITGLLIGTIFCYQDWMQVLFLLCMGGILFLIVFAGAVIDTMVDLLREKIVARIVS